MGELFKVKIQVLSCKIEFDPFHMADIVGAHEIDGIFGAHFAMVIRRVQCNARNDIGPLYSSSKAFFWCLVRLNRVKTHGDIPGFVWVLTMCRGAFCNDDPWVESHGQDDMTPL